MQIDKDNDEENGGEVDADTDALQGLSNTTLAMESEATPDAEKAAHDPLAPETKTFQALRERWTIPEQGFTCSQ